jgi:hypothetical protein
MSTARDTSGQPSIDGHDDGVLSPEEGRRMFDRVARELLGMSGDEFLRKLDSGEIVVDDTDSNVLYLWGLIPFARAVPDDGFALASRRLR